MRRVLVLVGLLFALVAAVAAPAVGAEGGVEREFDIRLDVDGFKAQVFVSDNDGEVSAVLIVYRGAQVAFYSAPATVTAHRVTARFGELGELDYRFAPKRNSHVSCTGAEEGEAVFEGTFRFTGENDYIEIEADRAEGSFQAFPEPRSCPQKQLAQRLTYHPSYSGEGATLHASAGSRAAKSAREVFVADGGRHGPHAVGIAAILWERREGMTIARGVQLMARSSAFRWNLETGRATLRPPVPFTGSATFIRHGDNGHGTWRGSLRMPILGGEPLELAGRDFRAFIHKGVPQDE